MKKFKTRDVAFQFRMGAGFPGDVNRSHPSTIEPALNDTTNPIAGFGSAVIVNSSANSVRGAISTDTGVTSLYGISVRPYPFQQSSATNNGQATIGGATPPAGPIDVLRSGYIIVRVNGNVAKGGAVFLWVAASSGTNVQGTFVSAATAGSTAAIANATFNGPADSNGFAEIVFNV